MTHIPFAEYTEALGAGCDNNGAWDCFREAAAPVEDAINDLMNAAILALHDLTVPQHMQDYDTAPKLRKAIEQMRKMKR